MRSYAAYVIFGIGKYVVETSATTVGQMTDDDRNFRGCSIILNL